MNFSRLYSGSIIKWNLFFVLFVCLLFYFRWFDLEVVFDHLWTDVLL